MPASRAPRSFSAASLTAMRANRAPTPTYATPEDRMVAHKARQQATFDRHYAAFIAAGLDPVRAAASARGRIPLCLI